MADEPTEQPTNPPAPPPAPDPAPAAPVAPAVTSAPAPTAPAAPAAEPKKGYGKRPVWQWVVLYVVLGAIVYAAIYFLFFSGHASSGSNPIKY
jgi:hypothetical protein